MNNNKLIWPLVAIICAIFIGAGLYLGLSNDKSDAPYSSSNNFRDNVQPDENTVIVYATRTGKKYHRGTCRYLRKSKIPLPLNEAKQSYGPCSVCSPPY